MDANCKKNITWRAWDGTSDIPYDATNKTAYVYLTKNVEIDTSLTINKGQKLYLCLNGHSITKTEETEWSAGIITVDDGAQFTLCDCKGGGKITHTQGTPGRGVKVGAGTSFRNGKAVFAMYGGTISGNRVQSFNGAGVIAHDGTFIMYDGSISENSCEGKTDYGGGGVCAQTGSTFIMYGGTISNNSSSIDGGGVFSWGGGSLEIHGGTISDNRSSGDGGGICTNCILTISGSSKIINNTATDGSGGGVYFAGSAFNISGSADISGNKKGGENNNIYLRNGKTITISRELTSTTPIGVTTEAKPDASSYVTIASGSTNYVHPDNFQYENDDTPISVITNGNNATLVACNHNLGEDWSTDDSNHWHTCSICNGKGGTATHNYDQEVVAKAYLMTSATCTSPATYYNSCVCGQKGTETFESGEKDASKHTGFLGDWQSDDKNHWKAYSCCNAHAETAAHMPGAAATEDNPQTCTTCGYELAPILAHTHVWGEWTSNGNGTHTRTCTKENSHTETVNCSGGTATCIDKAVCAVCGQEYGDKDPAKHSGTLGDWKSDNDNHWKEYSCCNAHAETAAHTPGDEATEDNPQTCTTCGYEIASALAHTHVWGEWTSNGNGTHTRICTKENSHTETVNCSGGTATCQAEAVCDTCKQPYGALGNHTLATTWSKDTSGHWHACQTANCSEKLDFAAHTPGAAATATTPQTCTACGYVIKAATGTTTSGGGSGYTPSPSPGKNDSNQSASTSVTVPVSGEDKSVQIDAAVSGTTATIENVYTSKLDTVIGNDVKVGTVTIDFSGLNKEVNAAKLPADVVARIAAAANDPNNDTENLKIVFTDNTSIVLDAKALGAKSAQGTAADLTISIKSTTNSNLNTKQQKAVGSRPALDINLTSAGKQISDMGGEITISAPYRLHTGEKSRGIVVYYVNEQGKKMRCETSYDPAAKQVSWKTDHLSVYMIGYDKSKVTPAKKPTTGKNTTAAVTYTVKRGDTLHAIARKYNTRVSKIVAANSKRIKNPNLIYSGWKLKIPQNQRTS